MSQAYARRATGDWLWQVAKMVVDKYKKVRGYTVAVDWDA